jgi:hypothetical protein
MLRIDKFQCFTSICACRSLLPHAKSQNRYLYDMGKDGLERALSPCFKEAQYEKLRILTLKQIVFESINGPFRSLN